MTTSLLLGFFPGGTGKKDGATVYMKKNKKKNEVALSQWVPAADTVRAVAYKDRLNLTMTELVDNLHPMLYLNT